MKAIQWTIAAAALAFVQPVQAAQSDPEVIIYRFPGVRDDGGAGFVGVATVFHCTNFSGVTENIRFVTRDDAGAIASNSAFNISHLLNITVSTHFTAAYDSINVATGSVTQGTTAIAATSTNIICTTMTIDAANQKPVGVSLRGIRFNPVPGSQE
jgi:predicted porin